MSGLILASRSEARARLLTDAGVTVALQPADLDEAALKAQELAASLTPLQIAGALSRAKALAVAASNAALVIGADQTLELEGALFDKPASREEARAQLLQLRGRAHQLHSAVTLARGPAVLWSTVQSVRLHVRAFSDAFLDAYLDQEGEALLGCVGAYRLEGLGAQLFDQVEGDYFAVLGLPLLPLLAQLRAMGEAPV